MFKVSFRNNSKKVQTFNHRATVVTIVGELSLPKGLWSIIPEDITHWFWTHPSVETDWIKEDKFRVEFSGKSVCAEDDTFNPVMGERLAESRAKIRLYKFMHTFLQKLYRHYMQVTLGTSTLKSHTFLPGSIYNALDKYEGLYTCESCHLNKLLKQL